MDAKRKDGRWEGRYIKERKPDGRALYGYLYARTYGEVRQRLVVAKSLNHQNYLYNKLTTNHSLYEGTLEDWVPYWLADISKRIKPSTYPSYVAKMNNHILPFLGKRVLGSLKEEEILAWLEQLKSNLAESSVRVIFMVLKTCCAVALKRGLLTQNPCQWVALPSQSIKRVQALSGQEQHLIRERATKHAKGLAIILALETGLRIGEISGLKWEDVDFTDCLLHVRRTIQRITNLTKGETNKTVIIEGSPKSRASVRVIPLSRDMIRLLKKARQIHQGLFIFGGTKPSEPRVISNWLTSICQDLSLPPVPFHVLRHSFATRCIEKKVTITTISALLGHQSIKMTLDTYTNSFLSEKRKAIQLIS